MAQIAFNGKTYNSLEEMPVAEREAYKHIMTIFKDDNKNGVPDMFEGDFMKNMWSFGNTSIMMSGGGQSYTLQDMPPEVRAKYEQAMTKLQQLGLLPAGTVSFGAGSEPKLATAAPIAPQAPAAPRGSPSVMQEDTGPNVTGILVVVLIALVVCAAAIVVGFLLFNAG